ncbi:MAG: hypothetical protein ACTSX0_05520 [Promethearchaeota archaeon]
MGNTFKWIALKAGTALGRHVPSLFYQLYYREIYRQLFEITNDPKMAVDLSYKLGYTAADESAQRQTAVFRMFPSDPVKVLEYIPLMWQIYFGTPMQKYTTEWDRSDPERPILKYKIEIDPMTFDIGKDKLRDNLPFDQFWYNQNCYGALMAGLLTQCSSFVLKLKGKDQRIILHNTKNALHGDPYFEFHCQIIPQEEFPSFELIEGFDKEHYYQQFLGERSAFESQADNIWKKITNQIDIDQLDEMMEDSAGLMRVPLRKLIKKTAKMSPFELFDHFTNDEDKFFQVLGFLSVHIFNEKGQLLEKLFSNDEIRRVYGHIFLFMKNNAAKLTPLSVIHDLKDYFLQVLSGIAPEVFIQNIDKLSAEEILQNYYQGSQKALTDLGIPFSELKSNLYQEIAQYGRNSDQQTTSNFTEQQLIKREQLYGELSQQMMIISGAIISVPMQFSLMLFYKTLAGSTELLTGLFKTLRESGQKIVDILDSLKDL